MPDQQWSADVLRDLAAAPAARPVSGSAESEATQVTNELPDPSRFPTPLAQHWAQPTQPPAAQPAGGPPPTAPVRPADGHPSPQPQPPVHPGHPGEPSQPGHPGPDSFDPASVLGRVRRGDPPIRKATRSVGRLFGSAGEVRGHTEAAVATQQPVTTGRRIAVVGVRGGCGKSTVTSLVASVLATRRHDHVLAIDADPDLGSLAWRLGVPTAHTLADVGPRVVSGHLTDLAQLAQWLPRTPADLWVLPGASAGPHGIPPKGARDVARVLARFFAVTLLDSGAGLTNPTTLALLDDAHATIMVTTATSDGVRSIRSALDGIARQQPDRLRTTVAVLTSLNPTGEGIRLDRAIEQVGVYGTPVHHLPYDRHLAAGAPIDLGRTAEQTVPAATAIAAEALTHATAR